MWIGVGITQFGGDPVFEALRNEVFQTLGFLMHLIPRIAEKLMQDPLEQAVVAQHLQCPPLSSLGQSHAMMLLVLYEGGALRGEFLEHASYGRRADPQMPGKRVARDALLLGAAQFQNRLQVVVNGLRGGWKTKALGRH